MKFIVSDGYAFAVDIDETTESRIYTFVALEKQPYPCVQVSVFGNVGNIDMLNYYANCSLSQKLLEKGSGSIHMLKVALTFVSRRNPSVKRYDIQDEAFINIPERPLITARRLILGEKGWYEEHFDARPTSETEQLLLYLRDPAIREGFQDRIPDVDRTWWSPNNTMALCRAIKCPKPVIGTTWYVPRAVIQNFGITYEEKETIDGGGIITVAAAAKRILAKALQGKSRLYSDFLDAKYRYHHIGGSHGS